MRHPSQFLEPSPWWMTDRHADRRPALLARNRIKTAIRAWFEREGFVEVEPGCLVVSPGNEAHLHAFATELVGDDLRRQPLYLNTSPEFAMKKLLAAGETRIFAFQPSFRNRERGIGSTASALHAAEFTMLEWYRVGEPYEQLWSDCADMLRIANAVTARPVWEFRGRSCDVAAPLDAITVDDAFRRMGVDLAATYDAAACDRDALAKLAGAAGFTVGREDSWSDLFSRILTSWEQLAPMAGNEPATATPDASRILHAYPASEAALARRHPANAALAERFELYCCGVELANGFGELVDARALRANLDAEMQLKLERYGERYPIDDDFIRAVDAMPAASGCALGFDRLVMLATGARGIDDVIWTPLTVPGR